jgi:hypothetical protein
MKLEKIYETLSPDERMRTFVSAASRFDTAEMDHLNDTVKEVTLREQNPAYFGRLRALMELSMVHGIQARDLALGITGGLFKVAREITPGSANQAAEAGADGQNGDTWDALSALFPKLMGHQDAWAEFCSEIGIDPAHLDFAFYQRSREILTRFTEMPHDDEQYAETLKYLRDAWGRRLARTKKFET